MGTVRTLPTVFVPVAGAWLAEAHQSRHSALTHAAEAGASPRDHGHARTSRLVIGPLHRISAEALGGWQARPDPAARQTNRAGNAAAIMTVTTIATSTSHQPRPSKPDRS